MVWLLEVDLLPADEVRDARAADAEEPEEDPPAMVGASGESDWRLAEAPTALAEASTASAEAAAALGEGTASLDEGAGLLGEDPLPPPPSPPPLLPPPSPLP